MGFRTTFSPTPALRQRLAFPVERPLLSRAALAREMVSPPLRKQEVVRAKRREARPPPLHKHMPRTPVVTLRGVVMAMSEVASSTERCGFLHCDRSIPGSIRFMGRSLSTGNPPLMLVKGAVVGRSALVRVLALHRVVAKKYADNNPTTIELFGGRIEGALVSS